MTIRSMTPARMTDRVGFLIVGTPRSGTTLVQRLVSELRGVRIPPETHFFPMFGRDLVRRREFPLDRAVLEEEVQRYLDLKTSRGMDLSAIGVADALGGRCTSALELFVEIVCQLAGEGEVIGEKTPNHLLWWKPLTNALSQLRIIAVVRDPRAVVNSYAAAPFGMDSPVALAESWVSDQRLVLEALNDLGKERCLVLRYEDVVQGPDTARDQLQSFLGRNPAITSDRDRAQPSRQQIFMEWETWKEAAVGPIVQDRIDGWRAELPARAASNVTAICRDTMSAFGYPTDPRADDPFRRLSVRVLGPADQWRRLHFRVARTRLIREIESTGI
jgi:hypothetical protein